MALRQRRLEKILAAVSAILQVSPLVIDATWERLAGARAESRERNVEGRMLKALDSSYGIALRFPRILRWRTDKPAAEADTLANLQAVLMASTGGGTTHA